MTDQIKIIQDISLLFELSLSVGSTLDPRENCQRFLRTLVSRKSLNFGSIWLYKDPPGPDRCVCELFHIHPHFRQELVLFNCSSFLAQELSAKPYFSITDEDAHFKDIIHETKVETGTYAFFGLGSLGFLKLFATNRPEGFSEVEMAQLSQVVDKLKISLVAGFAHLQLKQETEHRQSAQKALEESEQKLRRIIDSSLDAVVSANEQGLAIEWNAQAEKMFGYTRQEVLGKPLRDIFIPERHWPLFQNSFEDYLRTTDERLINKRYEAKCIRKDGTEFLAELSITADILDRNILFVGFLRDITEQRKAKKEIEQARIRMGTLISSLQSGILLEDKDGRIELINKAFCTQFGIPVDPQLLIGMNGNESIEHCKHLFYDPEAFIAGRTEIIQRKTLVTNEVFQLTTGLILERDYIPLFSEDGHDGHLWQFRDVTERQNTEQAIRESEEKYRGVLENMELGLLEVDLQENIIRANNAFCQMIGYHPEELVGMNTMDLFLPEVSKKIILERLEERKQGRSSVYELQFRRKDGALIWLLISGAPIKNLSGQVIGSIGIHFDLTERKNLENALEAAKMVAERARLAERQFLTHMSHEIRTPINAVIGMTHLLDETHPDPTQTEYLHSLRFSADSLLGIVDNILDLSKIDAGEIEFEHRPFDLSYLQKSLLHTFQFKIKEKDLQIKETVDPAIQNLVVGDPSRINQILTNLLANALKFTEKGVISLTTTLLQETPEQYQLEFRVHDTGIGIPADKLDTIFEYFKQADVEINRKFGGTGLGLTIVKQLVEMQGGSIRVESQLGVGSDFIVQLSFGNSGIPLTEHAALPAIDSQQSRSLIKGLNFLIVEDNLMNQRLLCKTIEIWEGRYQVANNGLEALEKTAKEHFDIILMDIHMPELGGFETTIAIRKDEKNPNQHVPIIALTAAALSVDKRRAFEAGMNGFLTKPIAPKLLQEHILKSVQKQSLTLPVAPFPATNVTATTQKTDLSYLLNLSDGDLNFVKEIIDAFLQEIPLVLQQLEVHVKNREWEASGKVVHKLKPNFAMLGMQKLETKAKQIEAALKETPKDPDQLSILFAQLFVKIREVIPGLTQQKMELEA